MNLLTMADVLIDRWEVTCLALGVPALLILIAAVWP